MEKTKLFFVDVPGAKQSQIRIGHVSIPYNDPDYYPITVMNYKLGGSFNGVVNLGSSEPITINDLALLIMKIARKSLGITYRRNKPVGVAARSSDNTFLRELINWEPSIDYLNGMTRTYDWISTEMEKIKILNKKMGF